MKHAEHKTEITLEFKTLRYDGQLLYTEQVWGLLGLVNPLSDGGVAESPPVHQELTFE